MSTKTRYLLQGLFFFVLAAFCIYARLTGQATWIKNFTLVGTVLSAIIGIIYIKNGLTK